MSPAELQKRIRDGLTRPERLMIPLTREECAVVLKLFEHVEQAPPPIDDDMATVVQQLREARSEIDGLKKAFEAVLAALAFYANPDTWFGIRLMPNRIVKAAIMDDYGQCTATNRTTRLVPGKLARTVLDAVKGRLG